ncbi:sensor domain-containing diguanylate cyclase [Pleionea sp. CnH1-48]|uniref:sensor domain-containing diguanylate cyclase n=1 Tax=Pleionea sp. CnH1-48 TaxID=2954494 RepID=UPI002097C52F|nr:sensor domain-containing diguanylate cyclase [Pleionea sp. CnH1-48]MCO7223630.1 DUF484 family protein [Pleionea sp. CnH1-48]
MALLSHTNDDHLKLENQRLKKVLQELIEKAQTNEQALIKFQQLELALLQADSLPSLFECLLDSFKSRFKIDCVSLFLLDSDHNIQELIKEIYPSFKLDDIHFFSNSIELEDLFSYGFKTQLRQKNIFLSRQLFPDQKYVESIAMLPLIRQGLLIGSYHLGSYDSQRFSPEMSTDFLDHLARICSICLENMVNVDKLKHLSLIDPLTRTKNRRCLYQWLEREVARSEREQTPLSVLFIDLDHFKQINDYHGHNTGDKTLKRVAQVIQPILRTTDLLARFGGEEFAILLPGADRKTAQDIAERIRRQVEQQTLVSDKQNSFKITCSIGASTWDPTHENSSQEQVVQSIIQCADKAVYRAKDNGRNRCSWHPFEVLQLD